MHGEFRIGYGIAAAIAASAMLAAAVRAQQVGTTGAVNPAAQASGRVLNVGSNIIFKERISTTDRGSVQVIFVDKTTLNIGPNSDMVIDEFVYNPNTGTGRMAATLTKGVLRVVGGNVTHSEGAVIKTPVATVGVRGGVATISHSAANGTRAFNHFGRLEITSGRQTETVRRPGFLVSVSGNQQPPAPPVRASAPEIAVAISTTTSQPGQFGGATARPTEAAVVTSGVGQTNAGLAPATTPSVQSQTASQAATVVTVPAAAQTAFITTIEQTTTQGQQQATTSQTVQRVAPTPKFYLLDTLGSFNVFPASFNVAENTPGNVGGGTGIFGYRRGGTDATGADRYGSSTLGATFTIAGTGSNQTSTFGVMTGGFTALSPTDQFHDAGFTGTTRIAGTNVAMGRANGNFDSVAGTETLNSDNIPTGATFSSNNRVSVDGTTQSQPSFYYLGNGTSGQNYSWTSDPLVTVTPPADLGQTRSGQTLTGSFGGIMRTFHAANVNANDSSVGLSFTVLGGITIQFNGDSPRMQANASIAKVNNFNGDTNEFQNASLQAGSLTATRGRGTYIDDTRFGAREAVSNPSDQASDVQISTTNSAVLTRSRQAFAVQNLVNGDQAITQLSPGITTCVCEYTRWGAWSVDTARTNADSSEERDRMHMGWWVAGRITDPAQIPTVGSATYNGHIVGSVKNSTVSAEYISAGGFQYNANFANPALSTMTVNGFDSANYSGTVGFNRSANVASSAGPSAISGSLAQVGVANTGSGVLSGATMSVNGAFYRGISDPAKDVAGNFQVKGLPSISTPGNYNYVAGGIWAGSR